jgi:hypothetical protein
VKKAPLFITLGLFVLVAGGFFTYQYFFRQRSTTIWEMIPEQTVLVYEANECTTCIPTDNPSSVSQLLEKLLFDVQAQDSVARSFDFLFTPKRGKAVSLHVISKDDFDVVYYFTSGQVKPFKELIDTWKQTKAVRFAERELNGFKIQEFKFADKLFSCVQLGDAWAGSFTSFLIEDVVRTYETKGEQLFRKEIAQVYALPRIKDDAGNIYIHLKNLTSWLKIFPDNFSADIQRLGQAGLLDIKQTENSITLNGFSLPNQVGAGGLLSYFQNQTPVQFNIKQYISNQTVFALTYGISDGAAFYKNLELSKNKSIQDSLQSFANIDYAKLFLSFGKELTVCYPESRNTFSEVIVFETQKPKEWLTVFDLLSEGATREDTVFQEQYSTYEIREIEIYNLPGKLFGPLAGGFYQTYYSSIGNYIILTGNIDDMKKFLEDIDQENVWGKSVSFNKFIESTLLESNISIYVNTPLVWNSLTEKLNPRWREFIQKNQPLLNSFDMGAIQFSHLNESFYTNITWTYSDFFEKKNKRQPVSPSDRMVANFSSSIISQPTIVKSHVNRDDEVLVQDSTYALYHLSSDGKVLWQKDLGERIVGEIHQVDFFANGKLQFFFATTKHLHIIDRLGNYVNPYPQGINLKDPQYVTLVDYDKSKKYRFLLSDKSGKLWMFDKEAQNLEGWMPKKTEDELFAATKHYRIRGKDYILAVRKDGYAYLMTRRGETIKGFPLNLEARPAGASFLETGNAMASTNFVCVSKDGFRIRFSLDGKIISRETLIKPSFDTYFSLIPEQSGKSYIIKRQDTKKLTLLDEEGKELVSNDFVGTNAVEIKYYDFGAGKVYYTITDQVQGLSFIYNGKGILLNATPLEGSSIELRPSRYEMPKTFIVDRNTLIIQ